MMSSPPSSSSLSSSSSSSSSLPPPPVPKPTAPSNSINRSALRPFLTITATYLLFTITDGALRTITLLFAYNAGLTALELSLIFGFYELAGVATNVGAGVLGGRMGIRFTLITGLALQMMCFGLLFLWDESWEKVSVIFFVGFTQVLGGVAKDLVKLGGKSVSKLVTTDEQQGLLFKLVSLLTGWKNSLKGVGYFLGSFLLNISYHLSLTVMLCLLALAVPFAVTLPRDMGKIRGGKPVAVRDIFRLSNPRLTRLSIARMFLFMSRDLWFEVPLPFYLRSPTCDIGPDVTCALNSECPSGSLCTGPSFCANQNPGGGCGGLGWSKVLTGTFLGLYIIVYGQVQSWTPQLVLGPLKQSPPNKYTEVLWGILNTVPTLTLSILMFSAPYYLSHTQEPMVATLVSSVSVFAVVFAINSSVHSYLVVKYAARDKVAMSVGLYYMSNACGRLLGTVGSGLVYSYAGADEGTDVGTDGRVGLAACMAAASACSLAAAAVMAGIEDGEGGLNCGRIVCVRERERYEEREVEMREVEGEGGDDGEI